MTRTTEEALRCTREELDTLPVETAVRRGSPADEVVCSTTTGRLLVTTEAISLAVRNVFRFSAPQRVPARTR